MQHSHRLHIVNWEDEAPALRMIRTAVFIHEQRVPEDLEWDEFDTISTHVLALNADGQPVGTVRLLPDGHVGRMAVLKEWRGKGIGSAMMLKVLEEVSNRGIPKVMLNAQTTAVRFYEKFGFQAYGKEFMDAGIAHVKMALQR